MIIIPVSRTPTEAESADIESKERYDDEDSREAFCAGARWQRGEDNGPPASFFSIVVGFLFISLLIGNVVAGLIGFIDNPCEYREARDDWYEKREAGYYRCMAGGKKDFIFPAYMIAGYTKAFLNK